MSQLGKPKSTTGCKTCKSRRVKCDEQKPVCARCIKAGRQCLGYNPWRALASASAEKSPSPQYLVSSKLINAEEELYFQIFLEDGRKQSVVPGDVDFWKTLVPQLSEQEPCIRYAVIAVGALLMQLKSIQGLPDPQAPSRSALTYYNKAIQQLLSSEVKKETALVSNVLFTCLECIQGHDTEALSLFHQGRRMFEEYWDSFGGTVPPSPITDGVRNLLARLRVLALLYGPAMADYTSPITGSPSVTPAGGFDSYEEARTDFFFLVGEIHELISESTKAKLSHMSQQDILSLLEFERDALQARLHHWKTKFWSLLEPSLYSEDNLADRIAVLTMQCCYTIMFVWLSCCLAVDESAYDVYLPSFQRLVGIAGTVVDLLKKSDLQAQAFSLEIGIIAPLYMTARKCRDPTLRQKTLDLLKCGRRQEGLWEAKQVTQILERVISIEGRDLEGQWPQELTRLQATLVHPRRTRSDGRRGNTVQFILTSRESTSAWDVWEEWFDV